VEPTIPQLIEAVRAMIADAEREAISQEGAEPGAGTNDDQRIARVLALFDPKPKPVVRSHIRGEILAMQDVSILLENGATTALLATGATTVRATRRQRNAHAKAHAYLSAYCATALRWELMFESMTYACEIMTVCRRIERNKAFVMMGIDHPARSSERSVARFPSGFVRPQEFLGAAASRIIGEGAGVGVGALSPGFAVYGSQDANAITFGSLCIVGQTHTTEGAATPFGDEFVWIPESAVHTAAFTANTRPLAVALRTAGKKTADDLTLSRDAADIYRRLTTLSPAAR